MNDKVKRNLKKLEELVKNIMSDCECILRDIEDVETIEDMLCIGAAFGRIIGEAKDGGMMERVTEDLFDEEEV